MVPSSLSTSLQSALSSQMSPELLLPPQEGQHCLATQCLHHHQLHLRPLVTLASLHIWTQHLLTAPAPQLAHRLLLNKASPDLTSVHSLLLHSAHHAARAMAERLIRKQP